MPRFILAKLFDSVLNVFFLHLQFYACVKIDNLYLDANGNNIYTYLKEKKKSINCINVSLIARFFNSLL